jgi:hypothetical protein
VMQCPGNSWGIDPANGKITLTGNDIANC